MTTDDGGCWCGVLETLVWNLTSVCVCVWECKSEGAPVTLHHHFLLERLCQERLTSVAPLLFLNAAPEGGPAAWLQFQALRRPPSVQERQQTASSRQSEQRKRTQQREGRWREAGRSSSDADGRMDAKVGQKRGGERKRRTEMGSNSSTALQAPTDQTSKRQSTQEDPECP